MGWPAAHGAAQERAQDGRELGGPVGRAHEHDEAGTPFNSIEIIWRLFGKFRAFFEVQSIILQVLGGNSIDFKNGPKNGPKLGALKIQNWTNLRLPISSAYRVPKVLWDTDYVDIKMGVASSI